MKNIIFPSSILIFISLTCCSTDDENDSKCQEIIASYNSAVKAYEDFPSFDNCEALEKASTSYIQSECGKTKEIKTVKCNPNLLNINFQFTLDLSLPQYSQLQFPSNAIYINGPNYGNAGIIVINSGSGFRAWDAADPNHPPSACSALAIDGLEGVCACNDHNRYDLITGSPVTKGLEYPLLVYRVVDNGNGTITVSN